MNLYLNDGDGQYYLISGSFFNNYLSIYMAEKPMYNFSSSRLR